MPHKFGSLDYFVSRNTFFFSKSSHSTIKDTKMYSEIIVIIIIVRDEKMTKMKPVDLNLNEHGVHDVEAICL